MAWFHIVWRCWLLNPQSTLLCLAGSKAEVDAPNSPRGNNACPAFSSTASILYHWPAIPWMLTTPDTHILSNVFGLECQLDSRVRPSLSWRPICMEGNAPVFCCFLTVVWLFFFSGWRALCSIGWSPTHCVPEDGLELLISLPSPPACSNYRPALPCPPFSLSLFCFMCLYNRT